MIRQLLLHKRKKESADQSYRRLKYVVAFGEAEAPAPFDRLCEQSFLYIYLQASRVVLKDHYNLSQAANDNIVKSIYGSLCRCDPQLHREVSILSLFLPSSRHCHAYCDHGRQSCRYERRVDEQEPC